MLAAALAWALLPPAASAEEGIRPIAEGLHPRVAAELRERIQARVRWLHELAQVLRLGYSLPAAPPEIYLVSRAYIQAHEREICFQARDAEEARACSSRVYGWIDDSRRVYVLRGEDVQSSEGFPAMRDFPAELWVEAAWTHELTHYMQMEGSPHRPSTLTCELEAKWEGEAFLMAAQWLHSLRSVDAERINTAFRGQSPRLRCADPPDKSLAPPAPGPRSR